jgi:hypothetical protein
MTLKSNDIESMLETVWDALHGYRENCIPEGDADYDAEWGDICTAMAWIKEDLNKENEVNQKRVTQMMVQHWVGSDHDNKEALLGLLVELANGDYTPEQFRNDVLNLAEDSCLS